MLLSLKCRSTERWGETRYLPSASLFTKRLTQLEPGTPSRFPTQKVDGKGPDTADFRVRWQEAGLEAEARLDPSTSV